MASTKRARTTHGAGQSTFLLKPAALAVAAALSLGGTAYAQLPTGAHSMTGVAGINTANSTMTVTTNASRSIANWQTFSIGSGAKVDIQQPGVSSAMLNRVVGSGGAVDPSVILGTLQSNGRVFLLNPSGIVFGAGAQVDVAGLVASTLRLSDTDFLANRLRFTDGAGAGSVVNDARPTTDYPNAGINAREGGSVYFVGASVTNNGLITTPKGDVVLAAGNSVELVNPGTPNLRVEITAPGNEARNLGEIVAEAGRVGIYAGLINHSGTIRADRAVATDDGRVVLRATKDITLSAGSRITASGHDGASGGSVEIAAQPGTGDDRSVIYARGEVRADGASGGTVTIKGDSIMTTGTVSADGEHGGGSIAVWAGHRQLATSSSTLSARGGSGGGGEIDVRGNDGLYTSGLLDASGTTGGVVRLLGADVKLAGATVDASGTYGGGSIRAGGGFQGGEGLPAAQNTVVGLGTTLNADAVRQGAGGKVAVWADGTTTFSGVISARGGSQSGDGGTVEVSGKDALRFGGTVNLEAPHGKAGTLLLDPKNIIIVPATGTQLGIELVDPNPGANNTFGASTTTLSSGNIQVRDPSDDFGGSNAGAVYLFDKTTGALLGAVQGTSANEQLGSNVANFSFSGGNYLIVSTLADVAGKVDAGAVIFASGTTGMELGRVSGNAANEKLGNFSFQFIGSGSNYLLRSPDAAGAGGVAQGGAAILVDRNTGTELGRVSGVSASERLGSLSPTGLSNGNYVIRSPNRTVAGNADAGAVVLASGATGSQLGQIEGNAAMEFLGNSVIPLGNSNYVIQSPDANGVAGVSQGGAVIMASGTTGLELGRVAGNTASERLGSQFPNFLNNGNYVIRSINATVGGNANAGAVILANAANGTEIGRVSGNATSEFLGSQGIDLVCCSFVDYLIRSPDAANGGTLNAGAVIRASGTTGLETGRVSGVSANERLGNIFYTTLFNNNYVIRSPNRTVGGNANAGAVVLADGTTGGQLGQVEGNAVNEFMGNFGIIQFGSNYLIQSPDAASGGVLNAGAVIMASATTGAETGRVSGFSASERLGSQFPDFLGNGNYVIRSPNRNVGMASSVPNAGAVVLADGATGNQIGLIQGNASGELLGNQGITEVCCSSNYLVRSPDRTNGVGATTAGAVMLAGGTTGTVIGSVEGATVGERLGSQSLNFLSNGHYVIRSINAAAGGNAGAGAVILANPADGNELGRLGGNAVNEHLGSLGITEVCCSANYFIRSPDANGTAGVSQGGAVIMASGILGTELGRASGVSASERLGNVSPTFISSGNYVIRSPNRTVSGNANAGAVVLADVATGGQLGQVEGNAANEAMGNLGIIDLGPSYLIRSPDAANGATLNAGAVIMANAANGNELGRTSGVSTSERLGNLSPTFLFSNSNYVIRSPNRTVGGNANAGAVVLADGATGSQLGQVQGNAANELLGNFGIQQFGNNYIIRSPDAAGVGNVAQGGAVIMASGTTGAELGRVSGASASEQLGNSSPTFLSNGNYIVRSPFADVGGMADAGAAILASGTTGAEIGRVSGGSANEQLGNSINTSFQFGNSNYLIQSTVADVGGLTDAGASILVSGTAGTEIGRVSGNAANERLGGFGFQFVAGNNYVLFSPDANGAGGVAKGGALILVNVATGTEIARFSGSAANERVGNLGFSTLTGNRLLVRSPDGSGAGGVAKGGAVVLLDGATFAEIGRAQGATANDRFGANFPDFFSSGDFLVSNPNASFGTFANAGVIVLVSGATGMEIARLSGTSANEQLGSNIAFLSGDRRLVRSPLADGNGLTDSGRLFLVGPGLFGPAEFASNQLFGSAPTGDATISVTAIINTLASGANLNLQANNDIVLLNGANIFVLSGVPGGGLKLQAGRSILLNASILTNQGVVTLIANESGDGAVAANRDTGEGAIVFAPGVSVGNGFSSLANNSPTALKVVAGAANPGLISKGNTTFTPGGDRIQLDVELAKSGPEFGSQLLASIDKISDINDALDATSEEDKKAAEQEKKKQRECGA